MIELRVPPDSGGMRLDRFVAAHADVGSRAGAERLIEAGRVLVDGAARPKAHRLAAGAVVTLPEPEIAAAGPPPADLGVPVVYADQNLMVVDKPAGLLVHSVPGYSAPTLVDALAGAGAGGEEGRPGIVHRLDRDTSGLLLVARDPRTHRRGCRRCCAGAGSAAPTWRSCAAGPGRAGAGSRRRSAATAATPPGCRSTPTARATPSPTSSSSRRCTAARSCG